MLMLLFWVGDERWAISSADIKDILPLVNLQAMPYSHQAIAGLLNYHGEMVCAIDISKVMTNQAAQLVMSTRIVMVDVADKRLALVVERAEETTHLLRADKKIGDTCYVQETWQDDRGVIQRLALEPLLALLTSARLPNG